MREDAISCGVSSYSYAMRVAGEFRIFTNVNSTAVDPKNFDARSFVAFKRPVRIVALLYLQPARRAPNVK